MIYNYLSYYSVKSQVVIVIFRKSKKTIVQDAELTLINYPKLYYFTFRNIQIFYQDLSSSYSLSKFYLNPFFLYFLIFYITIKGSYVLCLNLIDTCLKGTLAMIRFYCENCAHKLQVSIRYAGKKGRCPECKQRIPIPVASEVSKPELPIEAKAVSFNNKIKDDFPSDVSNDSQLLEYAGNCSSSSLSPETSYKMYWYDMYRGEILFKILLIVQAISFPVLFIVEDLYHVSLWYIIFCCLVIGIIHNWIFFSWVLTQHKENRSKILRISTIAFVVFLILSVHYFWFEVYGIVLYGLISFCLLPPLNAWYIFDLVPRGNP